MERRKEAGSHQCPSPAGTGGRVDDIFRVFIVGKTAL